MTPAQRHALTALWPQYGVDLTPGLLDFTQLFQRQAPTFLEIGFGNGAALQALASAHPQNNYLGIEVHRPGVGNLMQQLARDGLTNVRVVCADAKEVLLNNIALASLQAVLIFFPDPWHKSRHHKRRLIQAEFVESLRAHIALGGHLQMATDWEDYAQHMLRVMTAARGWTNVAGAGHYAPRPPTRVPTKFEQRGQRLGHRTFDLLFRRDE